MTFPSFLAGISTVTSERSVPSHWSPGSSRSRVLHGRHGTRIKATHSKEPTATSSSIIGRLSSQLSFGLASSGLLCSELRSPQRIKTAPKATTKKVMQNPNQTLRQKIGKSSMVVNMAKSKKSRPASVEIAILINTVRSSIVESPLESKTSASLNDLQLEYNIAALKSRSDKKTSYSGGAI